MKKLLKLFSLWLVFSLLFSGFSSASSDCVRRNLGNNSICINIDKWNNDRYTLDSDITCRDSSCAVSCSILLPNNYLEPVWMCNGRFEYDWNSSERVKLYITINNNFATIEWYYNFRNWTWWDIDDDDDNDDDSSISYDDLELSVSTTSPDVWSFFNLTIDTDNDYVWNVNFYKVQYRSSTSSSWTTISSRTNSTYFSDYSNEWEDGYYRMTRNDWWHKTIYNFLKFAKEGYYRIYAKDIDNNTDYIDFHVLNSSHNEYLRISTDNRNPSIWEYVDLFIETDNDYYWRVYLSAKYRSNTSSSWSSISNTSSAYFSNISSAWSNWYTTISYNWYKDLSDAFKFAKEGYYRIYAEDKNGKTTYIDFNVWESSNNNYLELSTSTTRPEVWNYVRINIDTDDDYVWDISFYKVQYRASTSNSWSTISSRTNSTYFSDYSDERRNGYYRMTRNDEWHKTISNFVKFAKKGYYRIYAKDTDNNSDYIDFNVWNSSTVDDNIQVSTNNRNPYTDEYVDLTIETDSDYNWNVYLSARYKAYTSDSWADISNTSSTYFSNRSSAWSNWYTTISSNWYKKLSDAFKFVKKWYYRVYVEDKYWHTNYVDFNVWESSTSSRLTLETNDDTPKASEYVDLTVKTTTSYRWAINFSAKYRASTSSSWTNISRTDSDYFINRSSTRRNWYINMTSSDWWQKTVENIFKFAKKWYYKIIAEDEDWYTTNLDFNVDYSNTSPLNWFTQKEYDMIVRIHNVRPTLIRKLKNEYPKIKNSSTWKNMSDELYDNMWDVIDKKSNRVFKDYDDFDRAFRRWFSYTQDLMD